MEEKTKIGFNTFFNFFDKTKKMISNTLYIGAFVFLCKMWPNNFFLQEKKIKKDINLVDPASSHTLVSKIKPCMSKYKQFCTVKLRMAH